MNFAPIKLTPILKDYIWGGSRLIDDFNIETNLKKAAESWELSTHHDGICTVATGEFKGASLTEYIEKNGKKCLGKNALSFEFFPLLIKLIDAKKDLSVQVHPDDEYALKYEHECGKTELWYIIDCDEDSYIYYGLAKEISKDEFKERIINKTILDVLNKVPVHKGDVFFIPSGTIHAICSGILLCEIQQNSNTTYRVYDYDRIDKNGKKRELHIDKALDVSVLSPIPMAKREKDPILANCKYFTVEKLEIEGIRKILITEDCFRSVIVIDGHGSLSLNGETLEFRKGDSIFIPAQNGEIIFSGSAVCILSYV